MEKATWQAQARSAAEHAVAVTRRAVDALTIDQRYVYGVDPRISALLSVAESSLRGETERQELDKAERAASALYDELLAASRKRDYEANHYCGSSDWPRAQATYAGSVWQLSHITKMALRGVAFHTASLRVAREAEEVCASVAGRLVPRS